MANTEFNTSEKPALAVLERLGYCYQSASELKHERESKNEVLLPQRVKSAIKKLNPWLNENQVNEAFRAIQFPIYDSLMDANLQFWEKLIAKDKATQLEDHTAPQRRKRDVHYIDFQNPDNNDWLVTNQLKYKGETQDSIPDIMVYVNGFPMAVIECKSPTASDAIGKAIADLLSYQENSERLFVYNFICAGLCQYQAQYGAIKAPQQFYSRYRVKDESEIKAFLGKEQVFEQDILLYSLFRKESFLDLLQHFTLFELEDGKHIKKLPRYQQVRATNNTIARLQQKQGGVVWATQGSGKSITMVYVTRKLQAEAFGFQNPTILVLTDRKDLDRQITNTFRNAGMQNVNQAHSVQSLKKLLANDYGQIITSTIHKFQEQDEETNSKRYRIETSPKGETIYLQETLNEEGEILKTKRITKAEMPSENKEIEILSHKENIIVLIDEAHRSQYGLLASLMRTALPHAKFIAFTGTPLSKDDKSTLGTFYGGEYLDVYTIKEAVEDGATLKLLYEQGLPEYHISAAGIDDDFEHTFGNESVKKKELLQKEAGRMFRKAEARLEEIAKHILKHYTDRIYSDKLKAMLVCQNRPMAIAYKKIFDRLKEEGLHHFESKVVMSLTGKADPEEYHRLATPSDQLKETVENFKLPFGNESETDKEGKLKYNNDAFLIVSDMLLTGYDAPIAGVLYLDKGLKEHTLLQALARVNRTKKGKKVGMIMDYYGIADNLMEALRIFSGESPLEKDDILADFQDEFPKLEQRHQLLINHFRGNKYHRINQRKEYIEKAVMMLEPLDFRDDFKDLYKRFSESIQIIAPDPFVQKYSADFKLYTEIKAIARTAYPDDDTLKISNEESQKLKEIIDSHLDVNGIKDLLEEPISIIDTERFKAEIEALKSPESKAKMIANRAKHLIKVGENNNPDFYKPLAQRLKELIEEYNAKRIGQLELFNSINKEIVEKIKGLEDAAGNMGFNAQEFAIYTTLEKHLNGDAQATTNALFESIAPELNLKDWKENPQANNVIGKKIRMAIKDKVEKSVLSSLRDQLIETLKNNA